MQEMEQIHSYSAGTARLRGRARPILRRNPKLDPWRGRLPQMCGMLGRLVHAAPAATAAMLLGQRRGQLITERTSISTEIEGSNHGRTILTDKLEASKRIEARLRNGNDRLARIAAGGASVGCKEAAVRSGESLRGRPASAIRPGWLVSQPSTAVLLRRQTADESVAGVLTQKKDKADGRQTY